MYKIIFAAKAKPGLTRAQGLHHLRHNHAPLVFGSATNRESHKTYIQNHALEAPAAVEATFDRDWIVESWRDETVIELEPPVAPEAIRVREDTKNFADRDSVLTVKVEEQPVWQATADEPFAAAPIKVITYYRRPQGMSLQDFDTIVGPRSQELAMHPTFRREVRSYIRNRTQPRPPIKALDLNRTLDTAPPYDAVDIWRFPDAEAVRRLFEDKDFRAALGEFEKEVADPDSLFRLMTVENVVFDDAKVDPASRL